MLQNIHETFAEAQQRSEWMLEDERAQSGAKQAVSLVVALMVTAIIAAFLLPVGLDELVDVNTTAWSDGAQSMWDILDVIFVLALFLFVIAIALRAAGRI